MNAADNPDSSVIDELIRHFRLEPHPEGGFFRRTYQSAIDIPSINLPWSCRSNRPSCTAILYLLAAGQKSCLHRLKQDELWHFYLGGSLSLHMISPQGEFLELILGPDFKNGEHLQCVVPAGYWFGAKPCPSAVYSLLGCTVSPGFDYADFEIARQTHLTALFPHLSERIADLF